MAPHALPFQRSQVIQGFFLGGHLRLPAPQPNRIPTAPRAGYAVPLPVTLQLARAAGGQRLPEAVQRKMEAFFRSDFSDVRIHVGREAASLGAVAFTHGSDLYFAPGQYDPTRPHGQRLLGHELTHVVQQKTGRVRNPFGSGIAVVQDPQLEAEAERMGIRVMSFAAAQPKQSGLVQACFSRVIQKIGEECPICMVNRTDIRLECGHEFCSACVKEHVKPKTIAQQYILPDGQIEIVNIPVNSGCPLCRQAISSVDKNAANWRDFQKKGGGGKGGFKPPRGNPIM